MVGTRALRLTTEENNWRVVNSCIAPRVWVEAAGFDSTHTELGFLLAEPSRLTADPALWGAEPGRLLADPGLIGSPEPGRVVAEPNRLLAEPTRLLAGPVFLSGGKGGLV